MNFLFLKYIALHIIGEMQVITALHNRENVLVLLHEHLPRFLNRAHLIGCKLTSATHKITLSDTEIANYNKSHARTSCEIKNMCHNSPNVDPNEVERQVTTISETINDISYEIVCSGLIIDGNSTLCQPIARS